MEPPQARRAPALLRVLPVALLFLVSGAAGLLYEVVWSRQLARVLGGSHPSVVATVTVFLGGLALGAALGVRLAERVGRPLRAYGLLEGGIGLYGAAFPLLLAALHPAFGACYRAFAGSPVLHEAARFAVAGAALLPPTVAMGATLPLLVRAAVEGERATVLGGTALLYGLNTLGAAGGALATGFLLLPSLGFAATLRLGAAANLAVAAGALILDQYRTRPKTAGIGGFGSGSVSTAGIGGFGSGSVSTAGIGGLGSGSVSTPRLLWVVAFGAGAASMLCQIGWTRALVLCFGSSVHAFTLVVAVFILGLGAGGLLAPLARGSRARLALALVILEAAAGAACWASVAGLASLPLATVDFLATAPDWGGLLRWQAGRALLLVLPATLAMGAAFPVLVAALAPGEDAAPRAAGRVYGVNTLGVVAGALGGGLLLLPAVGTRAVLLAAASIYLLLAVVAAAAALPPRRALPAAAALLAAAALAFPLAPGWPPHRFHAAVYTRGASYARRAASEGIGVDRYLRNLGWDAPFVREGRSAAVAVTRTEDGDLVLRVNGKPDANTEGDMDTQLLLGHLPMLARPGARRALVVGLASGMSAAAVASHGPETLEVAEISPEVAEAEVLFRPWNGDVTRRPGVRLLLEDGRAHVEHGEGTFDVIVSEPTNPWIAGVSDLFTAEFLRACRARLAPGGVLGVWLQAYGLSREDFRLVVRTVRSVFPSTTVWETSPGSDYLLLACADDAGDPAAAVAGRPWPGGEAAASLEAAGIRSREDALALLFLGREATAAFAAGGDAREIHTDDRLQLEFRLPRTELAAADEDLVTRGFLESLRAPGDPADLPGADPAGARTARAVRREAAAAMASARDGIDPATGDMVMVPVLREPARFEALLGGVPRSLREGLREKARAGYPPALLPEEAEALLRARTVEALEGARDAGCREFWLTLALARERTLRGLAALAEGDADLAEADFLRTADLLPGSAMARVHLSRTSLLRFEAGGGAARAEEALAHADRARAVHPSCEPAAAQRAAVLHALGRTPEAEDAIAAARALRPDSVHALLVLARIRRDRGRPAEALALVEEGLALEPGHPALLDLGASLGRGR